MSEPTMNVKTTTPTPWVCTECNGDGGCRRCVNAYTYQVCSTNGCGTALDPDNSNYTETLDEYGKRMSLRIDGKIVCRKCYEKDLEILT